MSGAQAFVEALERQKVEVIFGIVGGATLPIYDVLYDSDIRHVLARHEQCAVHAAEGYSRASGQPGVCMATSGPGATNLVTGIANAYMDSSPVISFTGQVNRFSANSAYMIGKDAFQEADIIGITTPITKYNYQVKEASEIPREVKKAFYIANTGRQGPVLIDLPKDTQIETGEMTFQSSVEILGYKPTIMPHPIQIKKAVELLLEAERPVIFAGGGVISSNASPELLALAELLLTPIATSLMGKGSFPEDHPLSLGMIGMHGAPLANKIILEADVMLAVGTRFSDRTTGTLDDFCPDTKIIHIDIDSAEVGKNVGVDIPIVADGKIALSSIHNSVIQQVKKKKSSPWVNRVQGLKEKLKSDGSFDEDGLTPPQLLKELRKILPEDSIVTTEVGQNQMWTALHFTFYKPRTFITSGGLGTMGFGFPAALGAKVACSDKVVVDVAGDGSFIMTAQDLACSVMENIPVIVIVLNNSVLGMVAQWQRLFYNRRYSSVNLGNVPDFVKLSEAYGAQGVRVGSLKEFSGALRKAIKSEVTTVIDVPISPEENVFPMIPPGKGLKDMVGGWP